MCRSFLKPVNAKVTENENVWIHLTLEMRIADNRHQMKGAESSSLINLLKINVATHA